jgi:hypothetical protein
MGAASWAQADDGCESSGQFIPFAATAAARAATGDPRPSVAERYPTFDTYDVQVKTAIHDDDQAAHDAVRGQRDRAAAHAHAGRKQGCSEPARDVRAVLVRARRFDGGCDARVIGCEWQFAARDAVDERARYLQRQLRHYGNRRHGRGYCGRLDIHPRDNDRKSSRHGRPHLQDRDVVHGSGEPTASPANKVITVAVQNPG